MRMTRTARFKVSICIQVRFECDEQLLNEISLQLELTEGLRLVTPYLFGLVFDVPIIYRE